MVSCWLRFDRLRVRCTPQRARHSVQPVLHRKKVWTSAAGLPCCSSRQGTCLLQALQPVPLLGSHVAAHVKAHVCCRPCSRSHCWAPMLQLTPRHMFAAGPAAGPNAGHSRTSSHGQGAAVAGGTAAAHSRTGSSGQAGTGKVLFAVYMLAGILLVHQADPVSPSSGTLNPVQAQGVCCRQRV